MDRIRICDLRVRCILGINQDERHEKQDVVINLTIHADLRTAGKSDQLEDTVDYRALKKRILVMVEGSRYRLVEALAAGLALQFFGAPALVVTPVRLSTTSVAPAMGTPFRRH